MGTRMTAKNIAIVRISCIFPDSTTLFSELDESSWCIGFSRELYGLSAFIDIIRNYSLKLYEERKYENMNIMMINQ